MEKDTLGMLATVVLLTVMTKTEGLGFLKQEYVKAR